VFIFVEDRLILSRKLNEDRDAEAEDALEFVYNNLLDASDDDASSEALSS
jgi:hypothetical protein